jgi:hypothetical protein
MFNRFNDGLGYNDYGLSERPSRVEGGRRYDDNLGYDNGRQNNDGRRYDDYELYGAPNRVEGREYIERGFKRDRLNEEPASRHAGRRYMHADSELTQEHRDAGMISNDYSKIANLPTEIMMKAYPPCPAYMDWEMEDNIIGVDRQIARDDAARRRGFYPHKY